MVLEHLKNEESDMIKNKKKDNILKFDKQDLVSDAYNIILSSNITEKERNAVKEFKDSVEKKDEFEDAAYWFINSLIPQATQGKLSPEVRAFYSKVYNSKQKLNGYSQLGGIGVVFQNI